MLYLAYDSVIIILINSFFKTTTKQQQVNCKGRRSLIGLLICCVLLKWVYNIYPSHNCSLMTNTKVDPITWSNADNCCVVKDTKDKGRAVFATRCFKPGEVYALYYYSIYCCLW